MDKLEGQTLPAVTFTDEAGKKVKSSELKAPYVLYVYPEDDTPLCTEQACSVRDSHADLKKAGLTAYGLSPDNAASHQAFIAKFGLPFKLLTADIATLTKLGVWKEKNMYGNKSMGVSRETFLVGPDGIVLKHYGKPRAREQGPQVLADWADLKES